MIHINAVKLRIPIHSQQQFIDINSLHQRVHIDAFHHGVDIDSLDHSIDIGDFDKVIHDVLYWIHDGERFVGLNGNRGVQEKSSEDSAALGMFLKDWRQECSYANCFGTLLDDLVHLLYVV
jgi:hypothetical protein